MVVNGCILVVNELQIGCKWIVNGCKWLYIGCNLL